MTNETNKQDDKHRSCGSELSGLVIRCTLTAKELQETPLTDDYAIPRMLADKGFKADGGPLQPKLRGQIGYTVDFETGNYRYFQTGV